MTDMRNEVIWAIREARTLGAEQKAILWAVESRGISHGAIENVAKDCGMTEERFRKYRKQLAEDGFLDITERPGRTTLHRVNADAVKALVPAASPTPLEIPTSSEIPTPLENSESTPLEIPTPTPPGNQTPTPPEIPETKKTIKRTPKGSSKETTNDGLDESDLEAWATASAQARRAPVGADAATGKGHTRWGVEPDAPGGAQTEPLTDAEFDRWYRIEQGVKAGSHTLGPAGTTDHEALRPRADLTFAIRMESVPDFDD